MPLVDILLWNCRGDLLHKTSDGCTSIAWRGDEDARWIAHNEDGDPFLYGRHTVDVRTDDAPGYISFYYPGSLPGHTLCQPRRAGADDQQCAYPPVKRRTKTSIPPIDETSLQ